MQLYKYNIFELKLTFLFRNYKTSFYLATTKQVFISASFKRLKGKTLQKYVYQLFFTNFKGIILKFINITKIWAFNPETVGSTSDCWFRTVTIK